MTVGIDEVGRGAWAGPLVAAAVVLECEIEGLNDSKLLSAKERLRLALEIRYAAKSIGIGWVSNEELDRLGMSAALSAAMSRALFAIREPYLSIVIDGKVNYLRDQKVQTIVGADKEVPVVSAASIIAKVARDTFMQTIAGLHPAYGFEKHVGYGTKSHREAIESFGLSRLHRRSFKPIAAYLNLQIG